MRLIEGAFPDWRQVIPKQRGRIEARKGAMMAHSLDRAAPRRWSATRGRFA